MKISFEQAENLLRRRMRTNQIIFSIAIALGIGAFACYILKTNSLIFIGLAFYFVFLGALNLPNINKCKSDINDYKKNNLVEITGKVLDLFPEKDSEKDSKNWYLFLETGEGNHYIEFAFPSKLSENITIEKNVKIKYTKQTQLPVEIEPVGLQTIETQSVETKTVEDQPIKSQSVDDQPVKAQSVETKLDKKVLQKQKQKKKQSKNKNKRNN